MPTWIYLSSSSRSPAARVGYLRQEIDVDGRQFEHTDPWEPADWATPLGAMVAVPIDNRQLWIRPWLYELTCPIGHATPVLLLDTRLEQNEPADRAITDRLYGGDEANRLNQEIVLGVGRERLLQALGFDIETYQHTASQRRVRGIGSLLPSTLPSRVTVVV